MRKLDFISGAPKIAIFRERANKTNLGGTLYLIYLIILALLAIIYISNYFSQEKFDFNYTLVKKQYNDENFLKKEEMKSMLETEMEYIFILAKDNSSLEENNDFLIIDNILLAQTIIKKQRNIEDGFIILNSSNISNDDECIIKQNKPIIRGTSNLSLSVLYRCDKNDCTIRKKDKILDSYNLVMGYKGFSIDHQNSEKPIHPLIDDYLGEAIIFFTNTIVVHLNWELIEYEEKKGIFEKTYDNIVGNKYIYYAGNYKSKDSYIDDGHFSLNIKDLNGNHFKLFLLLESRPNYREYEKYSRTKISILDALTNVFALSSTALNLMSLVYGFLYSENYDNYKLIENLLTKRMEINIYNDESIKKDNEDDKEREKIKLKTDLLENENENEKNDMNINSVGEEEEEEEKEKGNKSLKNNYKESIDLPMPKFLDFLIHTFYCNCCRRSRKQNLIGSCNNIVAKYVTIENILYNQIRLEYLWKDYKWNNPENEKNQKEDLKLDLKGKL